MAKSQKSWGKLTGLLLLLLVACPTVDDSSKQAEARPNDEVQRISAADLESAEKLFAVSFSDKEREWLLSSLEANARSYSRIRALDLEQSLPLPLQFDPVPPGKVVETKNHASRWPSTHNVELPEDRGLLAYYTVPQLASLIKTRKISSVDLTRYFIDRLKAYGPELAAVANLTEERALRRAKYMDQELVQGKYRGILHGIPYGVKDILAVKGYPTEWGATPYKGRVINETATVVERLDDAGAVLVAKLATGEVGQGDVWHGGMTKNPWYVSEGSSGSSAGPASAVAAGLVPFAIGGETLGSIVLPSAKCGVSSLRPTFGRVSRFGSMVISWSIDKLGPMCRSIEDCALVFDVIHGSDNKDRTTRDYPFYYDSEFSVSGLRVGYVENGFEKSGQDFDGRPFFEGDLLSSKKDAQRTLTRLKDLGAQLVPIELPNLPVYDMFVIVAPEYGAAFETLTLTDQDDLLVKQGPASPANFLRLGRFVSAVDYIQMNRARTLLMEAMWKVFEQVDVYVAPVWGKSTAITNLTGHPQIVLPNGLDEKGTPSAHAISIVGQLYDEGTLLSVGNALQERTSYHHKHPPLFSKPSMPQKASR